MTQLHPWWVDLLPLLLRMRETRIVRRCVHTCVVCESVSACVVSVYTTCTVLLLRAKRIKQYFLLRNRYRSKEIEKERPSQVIVGNPPRVVVVLLLHDNTNTEVVDYVQEEEGI